MTGKNGRMGRRRRSSIRELVIDMFVVRMMMGFGSHYWQSVKLELLHWSDFNDDKYQCTSQFSPPYQTSTDGW